MPIEIPERYAKNSRYCNAVNCKTQTSGRFRWCREHTKQAAEFDAELEECLRQIKADRYAKKKLCDTPGCGRFVNRGRCTQCHQRAYREKHPDRCKRADENYKSKKKAARNMMRAVMLRRIERVLKDRMLARAVYDEVYMLGYRAGLAAPQARKIISSSVAPAC